MTEGKRVWREIVAQEESGAALRTRISTQEDENLLLLSLHSPEAAEINQKVQAQDWARKQEKGCERGRENEENDI